MKIGIKIWPDKADYAHRIAEHADFIEVMAKRGCDFSFLDGIGLPFVVHAEHHQLGVNYADSSKLALSKESLGFATKLADRLDARAIIVHPGHLDGAATSKPENAIEFFRSIMDGRVLLENMRVKETYGNRLLEHFFSTPEEVKRMLSATNKRLCLDLSHTQNTAVHLGVDYIRMLEKFVGMKPRHFHACGGVEGSTEDMHMHLWEGNLNIEAFKRMLPRDAWVTLETPCDLEGQLRDIEIMRS